MFWTEYMELPLVTSLNVRRLCFSCCSDIFPLAAAFLLNLVLQAMPAPWGPGMSLQTVLTLQIVISLSVLTTKLLSRKRPLIGDKVYCSKRRRGGLGSTEEWASVISLSP
jgi:hypothetical protein